MFTGIVQAQGQIKTIIQQGEDARLIIATGDLDISDVQIGDSIAVNGVCLTAIKLVNAEFEADVSRETLSCTVGLDHHRSVNLEKALRLSDRLGGHLVSGHVDGIGQVIRFDPVGESMLLVIRAPHTLSRYIAIKGSVTIDGVSLTVNAVDKDDFSLNLIPHTVEITTLKCLGVGSRVNLEVDLIARYVDRMTQWNTEGDSA